MEQTRLLLLLWEKVYKQNQSTYSKYACNWKVGGGIAGEIKRRGGKVLLQQKRHWAEANSKCWKLQTQHQGTCIIANWASSLLYLFPFSLQFLYYYTLSLHAVIGHWWWWHRREGLLYEKLLFAVSSTKRLISWSRPWTMSIIVVSQQQYAKNLIAFSTLDFNHAVMKIKTISW